MTKGKAIKCPSCDINMTHLENIGWKCECCNRIIKIREIKKRVK